MKVGRTGTLGCLDVRKHYTLGFHLFPVDSFLMVGDIYALWSPQVHRQLGCNRYSSSSESRECNEERSESRHNAVWFWCWFVRLSSDISRAENVKRYPTGLSTCTTTYKGTRIPWFYISDEPVKGKKRRSSRAPYCHHGPRVLI